MYTEYPVILHTLSAILGGEYDIMIVRGEVAEALGLTGTAGTSCASVVVNNAEVLPRLLMTVTLNWTLMCEGEGRMRV